MPPYISATYHFFLESSSVTTSTPPEMLSPAGPSPVNVGESPRSAVERPAPAPALASFSDMPGSSPRRILSRRSHSAFPGPLIQHVLQVLSPCRPTSVSRWTRQCPQV